MSLDPRPRRRFGQNFLADRSAVERIVSALDPRPGEAVVEIGPGRGALTGTLVARAGRIAAVEVDRDLAPLLRKRFDPARLLLVEADVLSLPLERVGSALGFPPGTRLVLAGNLPFNISKPVASKLVRERDNVARAVLTFQREVALRLTASHGTKAYGSLTVLAGAAFRIERLFDLPPSAFRPRPGVVSTVTSWLPRPPEEFRDEEEQPLRNCLAVCFAHRRRTLWNNLRSALPGGEEQARALLAAADLDGRLRAEEVPPEGLRRLSRMWPLKEEAR